MYIKWLGNYHPEKEYEIYCNPLCCDAYQALLDGNLIQYLDLTHYSYTIDLLKAFLCAVFIIIRLSPDSHHKLIRWRMVPSMVIVG